MADHVANINRVIVKHLPTNEDLIQGIKKLCRENGIRYGQILSVIGSCTPSAPVGQFKVIV